MRSKHSGDADSEPRAVVIGGGVAGLLAARSLCSDFGQVTVVERAALPAEIANRSGAPQAVHGHIMLVRGKQILEGMFPGIERELLDAGAEQLDWIGDWRLYSEAGWMPRFRSGLSSWSCSRALLEWSLRRRLLAWPQVRIAQRCAATGLEVDGQPPRVAACRLRFRDTGRSEILPADLVVDCSGRTSAVGQWLSEAGLQPPAESRVDASLAFTSRYYKRGKSSCLDGWRALKIQPCPPDHPRGGMMMPVDGNRWLVTLGGINGAFPTPTEEGFLRFARSLRSRELYDAIHNLEPLGPICSFRSQGNRLRHFESMRQPMLGLIVIGDSLAMLNPLYGQGMTVAALEAEVMEQCLREKSRRREDWPSFSVRCQKRLASIITVPWLLAAGSDLRWPGAHQAKLPLGGRLFRRYFEDALQAAVHRPDLYRSLVEFMHILEPAWKLLRPRIMTSVVSCKVRGACGLQRAGSRREAIALCANQKHQPE